VGLQAWEAQWDESGYGDPDPGTAGALLEQPVAEQVSLEQRLQRTISRVLLLGRFHVGTQALVE